MINYRDLIKKEDFAPLGIDLPASMAIAALSRYLNPMLQEKILSLLGSDRLASYHAWRTNVGTPDDQTVTAMVALHEVLNPYLCYSVWASYFLQGNVAITETGPVVKATSGSDDLTDVQRTEVRIHYEGVAAACERTLRKYLAELDQADQCATPSQPTRQRFAVVVPRNKAKFDY